MPALVAAPLVMVNFGQIRKHPAANAEEFEECVIRFGEMSQQPGRGIAPLNNGFLKVFIADGIQHFLHQTVVRVPLEEADGERGHGFFDKCNESIMSMNAVATPVRNQVRV